jgi:hypothetical protein
VCTAAVCTEPGSFHSKDKRSVPLAPSSTAVPKTFPGHIDADESLSSRDYRNKHSQQLPAALESSVHGAFTGTHVVHLEPPPSAPWPTTGPAFCHVAQPSQGISGPATVPCVVNCAAAPLNSAPVATFNNMDNVHLEPLVHNTRTAACAHSVHEAVQDLMRALGESLEVSAPSSAPIQSAFPDNAKNCSPNQQQAPRLQTLCAHATPVDKAAYTPQQDAPAQLSAPLAEIDIERPIAKHAAAAAIRDDCDPSPATPQPACASASWPHRHFLSVMDLGKAKGVTNGTMPNSKRVNSHKNGRGWNGSSCVSPSPKPPRLKDCMPRLAVQPAKSSSAMELVAERRLVGSGRGRAKVQRCEGSAPQQHQLQREAAAALLEAQLAREAKENVRPGPFLPYFM